MTQIALWKPDFTKDNPYEGMPASYPTLVAAGFVPTNAIPLNPVQVAAIQGRIDINHPSIQSLTPAQQNLLDAKSLNELTADQRQAILAGNPIQRIGGTASTAPSAPVVAAPKVTTPPAPAAQPPQQTQAKRDAILQGKALAVLAPYGTGDGSYDLDKFWNSNKLMTADAKVALLQRAGFSDKDIANIEPHSPRTPLQRAAEIALPDTGKNPLKQATAFAAETMIPGLYEKNHWGELSGGQKALMIGIDAVSLIPLVGAAARGAREVSVTGRAVEAARFGGAVKGVAEELKGYATAPVNIILHPIGTAKSSFREVSGLIETIADPRKLPEASISNIFHTMKIRIPDTASPAEAMAIRDEVVRQLQQTGGKRLEIQIGDKLVTIERSPLMREIGGGAGSGTAFAENDIIKGLNPTSFGASNFEKMKALADQIPQDVAKIDIAPIRKLNFADATDVPQKLVPAVTNYIKSNDGKVYGSFVEWLKIKGADTPHDIDVVFKSDSLANKARNDLLKTAKSAGYQARANDRGVQILKNGKWTTFVNVVSESQHANMIGGVFTPVENRIDGIRVETIGSQAVLQRLGSLAGGAKAEVRAERLATMSANVVDVAKDRQLTAKLREQLASVAYNDGGIYFSPTPAPRFSLANSHGQMGKEHAMIILGPETAKQLVSSNKIYSGTAELESILPEGTNVALKQKLYTRVGPGAQYTELWLEKPLSASQIAKLKVEGLAEVLTQPFRPAIKIEGDALAAGAEDVSKLAEELRLSGNSSEARNLESAYRVLEQDRRSAPLLNRLIGRVSASELAKARANVSVETRRNLTPEDRRLLRQPIRELPREPARETPRTPSRETPREPDRTIPREPGRDVARTPDRAPPREPGRVSPPEPPREPGRTPPPEPPRIPPRQPPQEPPRYPPEKPPTRPPAKPPLPSNNIMGKNEQPTTEQLRTATALKSGFGWWVKLADGRQKFYTDKKLPGEVKKVKGGEKAGYRSVQTFEGTPARTDIKIGFLTAKVDRPAKEPGKPGAVAYVHNFDQGGIIPGEPGQPVSIKAQAGEIVIPLKDSKKPRSQKQHYLGELLQYVTQKGDKVEFVGNKVLHDYAATNPEFDKLTGWPAVPRTYQIDKNQNLRTQMENLRHEIIENNLMKSGVPYGEAHLTALKLEKVKLKPKELDALAKIGSYSVSHIHDDGDLTIKSKGQDYVVTTEGEVFKGTKNQETKMRTATRQKPIGDSNMELPYTVVEYGDFTKGEGALTHRFANLKAAKKAANHIVEVNHREAWIGSKNGIIKKLKPKPPKDQPTKAPVPVGELNAKQRGNLPDSAFAIPDKRAYPIHDVSHARNALARVAQHGTPMQKHRVRAAVYARYPELAGRLNKDDMKALKKQLSEIDRERETKGKERKEKTEQPYPVISHSRKLGQPKMARGRHGRGAGQGKPVSQRHGGMYRTGNVLSQRPLRGY